MPVERRGGGLKAFTRSLDQVRKKALGRLSPAEAGLHLEWTAIVGETLAAKTLPRRLRFAKHSERRDGTLTIACEPAFALELQHMLPLLIERLNAHFGYRAVAKVRLEQANIVPRHLRSRRPLSPRAALPSMPPPKPEELPDEIEDEGLAEALARLRGMAARANAKAPR